MVTDHRKILITDQNEETGIKLSNCFLDILCHCLPGMDDGPQTINESIALCKAIVEDGVSTVIATRHQLGSYDGQNVAEIIRCKVKELNSVLQNDNISLIVLPGADIRIDERIIDMLKCDNILTLGDPGHHLLLELPDYIIFDISPLLLTLADHGIQAILSHPERHTFLARNTEYVRPWLKAGASLQVTAASLLGDFGPEAENAAWQYLSIDPNVIIASDAHNVNTRKPKMTESYQRVEHRLGRLRSGKIYYDNPARLIASLMNKDWREP